MLPHLLAWLQWNFAMAACWPSLVWLPTRTSLSVPRPGDLFSWRLRRKAGIALGRPPMQPLCSTPKETGPSFRCWRPAGSSCCAQTKVCPEGLSRRALHGRLPVLSLNDRAGLHDYSLNLTHRLRVHWLHMKIRLILHVTTNTYPSLCVPIHSFPSLLNCELLFFPLGYRHLLYSMQMFLISAPQHHEASCLNITINV